MNAKKFISLSLTSLLVLFSLASCDGKDDDLLTPAQAVSDLSFTDTDTEAGKIAGTLTWTLPDPETNIDEYVVYLGDNNTDRSAELGKVTKGTTSLDIPQGTVHKAYLLVVAKNAAGESTNIASLAVTDLQPVLTPGQAVSNLAFTDTDPEAGKIAGTLTWTLPESETDIDEYVVYLGDNETDKNTELGTVTKGTTSFDVPAGTGYKAFFLVVAKNDGGESSDIAALAVTDRQPASMGFYILNRGNWNENNASLAYYNFTTGVMTPNLYRTANNEGLGDGAEQLLVYGSKVYVTVTTSSRLAVMETGGRLIQSLPIRKGNVPMEPRCMAAHNGKVYVSYYAGHSVAVLDTATLTIEKEVSVGRYPEQLAITGGKLYVANSGGLDGSTTTGYGKTVSVIDLQSFTVEKEIEVVINPVQLAADSQGDVYLISMGDYGTVKNTLQRIDGATGTVTTMGEASLISLVNDKLYAIYAQYNDPNITYRKYDALTETVENDSFITDGTSITSPNALAVDPVTGKIYITDFVYGSTATLYLFSADGRLEKREDTGGYDAKWMTFLIQR
ncbi:MAG: hypothetical protein LBQ78_00430 [Tannerellaceae bacterium]|jgi:YVTN family beta-propeller protein|nr:hypothetical protein [Tannerellaceae bacterium]